MSTKEYPIDGDSTDTVTNLLGWGFYSDGETAPATQTFSATPSKLQVDALGATTSVAYLPSEITDVSSFWDSINDKITPFSVGDSYDLRIDLLITAKASNPALLNFNLDIGGGATPTINVVSRDISLSKTPPYKVSIGFPIFCLATFKANGGQLFFNTDAGTVTVGSRAILLVRNTAPSQ